MKSSHRRRGLTYLDVLVLLLSVTLIGAAALPGIAAMRESYNRVKCSTALRAIGQGFLQYAMDNKVFPRTRYVPDAKLNFYTGSDTASPFGERGPAPNDVTAALFLLVRNGTVNPRNVFCSSVQFGKLPPEEQARQDPAMAETVKRYSYDVNPAGWINQPKWDIQHMSNFTGGADLNYSIFMPYPDKKAVAAGYKYVHYVPETFAIAADLNPGVDDLLKTGPEAAPEQMRRVNSPNHHGDGQNVLFPAGYVEWHTSPFAGVDGDNIYTAGRTGPGKGGEVIIGQPTIGRDTVLLPVAGQKPTTQPTKGK